MINGAAVLQEENESQAGENPCFFFGKKMSPEAFFGEI